MIVLDRVAKESVMKALLCTRLGPPESLVLTEGLPSPKPSAGEVKLQVLVAGINFPDTLIIEGKYQFKPDLPFAPGGEAVARVAEVGEGVEGLAVGDRVIACNAFGMLAEEVCLPAYPSHQAGKSQALGLGGGRLPDDLRDLPRLEARGTPRERRSRCSGPPAALVSRRCGSGRPWAPRSSRAPAPTPSLQCAKPKAPTS